MRDEDISGQMGDEAGIMGEMSAGVGRVGEMSAGVQRVGEMSAGVGGVGEMSLGVGGVGEMSLGVLDVSEDGEDEHRRSGDMSTDVEGVLDITESHRRDVGIICCYEIKLPLLPMTSTPRPVALKLHSQ